MYLYSHINDVFRPSSMSKIHRKKPMQWIQILPKAIQGCVENVWEWCIYVMLSPSDLIPTADVTEEADTNISLQTGVVICIMTKFFFQKISVTFPTSFRLSGTFLFLSLSTKWTLRHYSSKLLPVKEPTDLLPPSVLQLSWVSLWRLWELLGGYFSVFSSLQSSQIGPLSTFFLHTLLKACVSWCRAEEAYYIHMRQCQKIPSLHPPSTMLKLRSRWRSLKHAWKLGDLSNLTLTRYDHIVAEVSLNSDSCL